MWGLSLRAYTMTLWAVSVGTQPRDCSSDAGGGCSGGGGGCGGRPPVLKAPRWVDCLLLLAGSDADGLKIALPSQGLVAFRLTAARFAAVAALWCAPDRGLATAD